MAVSSISPSTASGFQPTLQQSGFFQAFQKLARALAAGALQGAQQAYSTLQQMQANGSRNDPNNPLSQALNQIGQYLQSGDLTDAQKTLVSLFQQLQGDRGYHNRFTASDGGNSTNAASSTATNSDGGQSAENLSLTVTDSLGISISGNGEGSTSGQTGADQTGNNPSLTITETIGLAINLTV